MDPGTKLRPTLEQKRRIVFGLCAFCGYDLRASPTRCPECGQMKLHPSDIKTNEPGALRGALVVLTSVGIFALLIATLRPSYTDGPPIKVSAAMADLSTIKTQLSVFQIDTGRLPTTAEGLNILVTDPGNLPGWTHAYLDKFPLDPWQHPYIYQQPGKKGGPFDLFSWGPDGIAGTADDMHIH